MSTMDMDDDELVAELPVYLNQDLAKQLYLLQYPLRSAQRPYSKDLGELTSVRVKPHQKKVSLSRRDGVGDDDDGVACVWTDECYVSVLFLMWYVV